VAGLCLALDGTLLVWTIMAKPLPIDVLMKNALSGVAWFMLCVINGIIISDTKNPYSFIVCTAIMYALPHFPTCIPLTFVQGVQSLLLGVDSLVGPE